MWVLLLLCITKIQCDCVMYGLCYKQDNDLYLNCNYTGKAKLLEDKSAESSLKDICPQFYNKEGTYTCCDAAQIEILSQNLNLIKSIVGTCPACTRNLLNFFCEMTCSPEQSKFNKALSFGPNNSVKSLECLYSQTFVRTMYDSCKGMSSFDTICGTTKCTLRKLLKSFGTASSLVPFDVLYATSDYPIDRLVPRFIYGFNCTSDLNGTAKSCSCQDCPAACVKPIFPECKRKTILGIDLFLFMIIIIGSIFVILFGSANIVYFGLFDRTTYFDSIYQPLLGDSSPPEVVSKRSLVVKMSKFSTPIFRNWGMFCYRKSYLIIILSLTISMSLSIGNYRVKHVNDPVKMFISPNHPVITQKKYYDENFGPFYRIEQIIVKSSLSPSDNLSSVLDKDVLTELLQLEDSIKKLKASHNGKPVMLSDICFSPMSPFNDNCMIQSVSAYFQGDVYKLNITHGKYDYVNHIEYCANNPLSFNDDSVNISCFSDCGAPVYPNISFGGFNGINYIKSEALVVTFLVRNGLDRDYLDKAEAWERVFLSFLSSYKPKHFSFTYSAEISISSETDKIEKDNLPIICGSILVLFISIFFTSGLFFPDPRHACNIISSLTCILITIISIYSTLGIYSFAGFPLMTPILPYLIFLVFTISVINSFLLQHNLWWRNWPHASTHEEMVGDLAATMLPSIVISSLIQSVIFFCSSFVNIPIIRSFGLYASLSIFINLLLCISLHVATLKWSVQRRMSSCIPLSPLRNFMRLIFSRIILKNYLLPMTVGVFFLWFLFSISSFQSIEVGIKPISSFPQNSPMYSYLLDQGKYLRIGSPVYFVVMDGYNYSSEMGKAAISGSSDSLFNSLGNVVAAYSRFPQKSGVASTANNWLDHYSTWRNYDGCCRYYRDTKKFCNSTVVNQTCIDCDTSLPFLSYVDWFLEDIPCATCPSGGRAEYLSAINLKNGHVGATNFMAYHIPMNTSEQYTHAYSEAKRISTLITDNFNRLFNNSVTVFPYSNFYVFFAQNETILATTHTLIYSILPALLLLLLIFYGFDIWTTSVVFITVTSATYTLFGTLSMLKITLNPFMVINLLMAIGVFIECVVHSARSFSLDVERNKVKRVTNMVEHNGTTIVCGFTLVWIVGASILSATTTQLTYVYFFQTFMVIVLVGSTHALILLPILLLYIGPSPLITLPDEIRYFV